MQPGLKKTLLDMVTETNESFNLMVGDSSRGSTELCCALSTRAWASWRSRAAAC